MGKAHLHKKKKKKKNYLPVLTDSSVLLKHFRILPKAILAKDYLTFDMFMAENFGPDWRGMTGS